MNDLQKAIIEYIVTVVAALIVFGVLIGALIFGSIELVLYLIHILSS